MAAARKRGSARAAALARHEPRPAARAGFDPRRFLPSWRSFAVGIALLALGIGAYAIALETSVFAVRTVVIAGGTSRAQSEVRAALAPELGRSLLRVSSGELDRRTLALPDVVSIRFDRSFPHTLKIRIVAERPVMLLRRGHDSWLISSRGRVMRDIGKPGRSSLPRLWVPKGTSVKVGATLSPANGALAAAALAPISSGALLGHVRFVQALANELTLVMGSGLQIRLGGIGDLRLKLAIARRILLIAGASAGAGEYIDVSVPERPVLGAFKH